MHVRSEFWSYKYIDIDSPMSSETSTGYLQDAVAQWSNGCKRRRLGSSSSSSSPCDHELFMGEDIQQLFQVINYSKILKFKLDWFFFFHISVHFLSYMFVFCGRVSGIQPARVIPWGAWIAIWLKTPVIFQVSYFNYNVVIADNLLSEWTVAQEQPISLIA